MPLSLVNPTVISTFAGCGGSSLGYKMAGFRELLAIDFDKNATETFKLNFPEVPVWLRDITTVTADEILSACNLQSGELDVLDGSPPCQGFSTAGNRQVDDPRNSLFKDFCRLIDGLKPKVFVMENVTGMIKGPMKGMFLVILQTLKDLGYNVKCKQMNAKYYEVPQSMERLIFIGMRSDLNITPSFPIPINKLITFRQATRDIVDNVMPPPLSRIYHKWVPFMKQGQSVADVSRKNSNFQTERIYYDRVCPTLTKIVGGIGFGAMIHPTEDRVLSEAELKRICSFPDDFQLTGSYKERKARLGNAVMPKMMYHIAKHIKEIL